MFINDVRRVTLLAGIMSLLGVSLILAACGGAASSPTEVSPPTGEVAEAAATLEDTPVVTEEPAPTTLPAEEVEAAAPASETEPEEADSGEMAECQPADPNVDPIAGAIMFLDEYLDAGQPNANIAAVNNADWSKGPANAPVTLIEYGDFQ